MMIVNTTIDVPAVVVPSVMILPTTVYPSFVPHGEKLEKFRGVVLKDSNRKRCSISYPKFG